MNATLISGPTHGDLILNSDGSFTYTPAENYNGPDSFTYQANDGSLDSNIATVSLTITAVNDNPVANNDSATTNEDQAVTINVLANDTDVDGNTLSISSKTNSAHGSVAISGSSLIYTPNANFNGTDSFTYTISDGNGGTASATVNVTVDADNDAPVAANDSYSTAEDTVLTITAPGVLGNDTDIDSASLSAVLDS